MGVVAALEVEARTLGPAVRRSDGLSCYGDGTLLAISGMGSMLAGAAAHRLADAGASALLSFGFTGGLEPNLRAGTIVLPTEVISRGGARFPTSADWCRQLRAAIVPLGLPPVSGTLLTSATPIASIAEKAAAFRETGAIAVDMESLGIAEVAAARDLPFIAVRVIVDTATDALPRVVLAASRGGRVSMLRLAAALAAAPVELAAVIRLATRYRAAVRSLAAIARGGLPTPTTAAARTT